MENELDEITYTKDNLVFKEDAVCKHIFKRVAPNRVECVQCHIGFFDDPSSQFPLEALNDFFQDPKNNQYFKSL